MSRKHKSSDFVERAALHYRPNRDTLLPRSVYVPVSYPSDFGGPAAPSRRHWSGLTRSIPFLDDRATETYHAAPIAIRRMATAARFSVPRYLRREVPLKVRKSLPPIIVRSLPLRAPSRVLFCLRRKERREVLFAFKRAGYSGSARKRHYVRNQNSRYRC